MLKLYKAWGIQPNFLEKLSNAGIQASSLVRDPKTMRDFESFRKEAMGARKCFLIQCFQGQHSSAAYALYYLAKVTPYSLKEIKEIFTLSGRAKDFALLEKTLASAKIYLKKMVERKMRLIQRASKPVLKGQKQKKHRRR